MIRTFALTTTAMLLAACGSSLDGAASSSSSFLDQGPTTAGRRLAPSRRSCASMSCIYVAQYHRWRADASVPAFPVDANGNVPPIAKIIGRATGLDFPISIAVDAERNIYVGNACVESEECSSVSVYPPGSYGNAAPSQLIEGADTALDFPTGVAVDAIHTIYVANDVYPFTNSTITIYAPGATGNVAPTRTIAGSNTGLDDIGDIAVDASQNIYVTHRQDSSITVFAADASGNVAPIRTIAGPKTALNVPLGIALDDANNVYVTNFGGASRDWSLTVYRAGRHGNIAPMQQISGSHTMLSDPVGIAVDANRRIYVGNDGTRQVLVYPRLANGDVAPVQAIGGFSKTGRPFSIKVAVR